MLDGTCKEYVSSAGGIFSQRTDFDDAIDFVGWYNYQSHKNLGI